MKSICRLVVLLVTLSLLIVFFVSLFGMEEASVLGIPVIDTEQASEMIDANGVMELAGCGLTLDSKPVPYDPDSNTFYLFQSDGERWHGRLSFSNYVYSCYLVAEGGGSPTPRQENLSLLVCYKDCVALAKLVVTDMPLLNITFQDDAYTFTGYGEVLTYLEAVEEDRIASYCLFSYDETYGRDRAQSGFLRIHIRGAASTESLRQSFKLTLINAHNKLDKKSLLGMRKDDDWILNAINSDMDKVREKTAYQLWKDIDEADPSFSMPSSDAAYVELFINGKYLGLYYLQTRIDAKQVGLNRREDMLYKSYIGVLPSDPVAAVDSTALDTGNQRIVYVPPEKTNAYWTALQRYNVRLVKRLDSTEPALTWEEAERIANLPNLIDFFLYKQALWLNDNAINNAFFWAVGNEGRITKIPWDMNYAFGDFYDMAARERTRYDENWSERWLREAETENLLYSCPQDTARLLAERWALLSASVLNEDHVRSVMLSAFNKLWQTGAFQRNQARWSAIEPQRSYDECMEQLTKILLAFQQKCQQIDDFVNYINAAYASDRES